MDKTGSRKSIWELMGYTSAEHAAQHGASYFEKGPSFTKDAPPLGSQHGASFLTALTVPVRTAVTAVAKQFSESAAKNPQIVDVVAKRVGVSGGNLSSKIVSAIKGNKMTAALVAYELGSAGVSLLDVLRQDDEVAGMIERYKLDFDTAPNSEERGKFIAMHDEFRLITEAARVAGGLDRFHVLRRAILGLTDDHFRAYDEVRALSKAM